METDRYKNRCKEGGEKRGGILSLVNSVLKTSGRPEMESAVRKTLNGSTIPGSGKASVSGSEEVFPMLRFRESQTTAD